MESSGIRAVFNASEGVCTLSRLVGEPKHRLFALKLREICCSVLGVIKDKIIIALKWSTGST